MNCSFNGSRIWMLPCLLVIFSTSNAYSQTPVYQIEQIPGINDEVNFDEVNNLGLIRGRTRIVDGTWNSFIYDSLGIIGSETAGTSYLIDELVAIPETLNAFLVRGINDNGTEVVGYIENQAGELIACYADLSQATTATKAELVLLGSNIDSYVADDINDDGDIVIRGWMPDDNKEMYLVHRSDLSTAVSLEIQNIEGQPKIGNRRYDESGNLVRHAIVSAISNGVPFRYTIGSDLGDVEYLDASFDSRDMNTDGVLAGTAEVVTSTGNGKRPQTVTTRHIAAYENGLSVLSNGTDDRGDGINNQRDIVGDNGHSAMVFLANSLNGYDGYLVEDLVASGPEGDFVRGAWQRAHSINDLGQITLIVERDGEFRFYLLTPVSPEPGIIVSPNFGLVTSEDGGSSLFEVQLESQPTADVTIGLSSSNTDEGTIDLASLTFTPANWDTPQTVTITGIDDGVNVDGDQQYWIETAPAFSGDADYNGLDADDVSVTNLDNDSPPGGGSVTESSGNINLDIPDNSPGGVSHTITNVGDYDPLAITVNLDISHERMGDLLMWVTPPGGPAIPVSNGDNDLTGLVTATQGNWTLEVIDTRNKKTGTLNGWSITIDY